MKITDVKIKRVEGEGRLLAYANVTFDESFVVHNIRVIRGDEGLFIAMPRRKTNSGEYKDVAHPINAAFRAEMEKGILEAFEKEPKGEPKPSDNKESSKS